MLVYVLHQLLYSSGAPNALKSDLKKPRIFPILTHFGAKPTIPDSCIVDEVHIPALTHQCPGIIIHCLTVINSTVGHLTLIAVSCIFTCFNKINYANETPTRFMKGSCNSGLKAFSLCLLPFFFIIFISWWIKREFVFVMHSTFDVFRDFDCIYRRHIGRNNDG